MYRFEHINNNNPLNVLFLIFCKLFLRASNTHQQRRSQNLKEVPQSFSEVFNIDGVTANDVIQRNQNR